MTGLAVRESVTVAGRPERARAARAFVGEVLGPGHPCQDAAILLVSEIFSNSIQHSASGAPGKTVTVAVISGDGTVRVEVTDRAGPGTPELRPASRDAEGGRGLQIVAGLAARWGWRRCGGQTVTWFELRYGLHLHTAMDLAWTCLVPRMDLGAGTHPPGAGRRH